MNSTDPKYARYTLILILALLAFRVVVLLLNPLGLHGDEAQYFAWSRELDFGYYSKPPLIAWIIAGVTSIFGTDEWAVRLASPLLHSLSGALIYVSGRRLVHARAGFWAAAVYLTMPGVFVSSAIISTDAALLTFWTMALYFWTGIRRHSKWARVIGLGLAIGFGLLAKYAMMFFLPAFGLAVLFDTPTRKALLGPKGLLVLALIGVVITPNLLWNAQHEFATLGHTVDNANLGGQLFQPVELFKFIGDQFGVFGPVSFALLPFALWHLWRGRDPKFAPWLVLLCATPLIIIMSQALLSRANANWAVSGYVAGSLCVAVLAVRKDKIFPWVKWGIIAQGILGITLSLVIIIPGAVDALGLSNSVKRLRAWPETISALEQTYAEGDYARIAFDHRLSFYDADYYGLDDTAALYIWPEFEAPGNHAELTAPLPLDGEKVLIVSHFNKVDLLSADFADFKPVTTLDIPLGGGKIRKLHLYSGRNFNPKPRWTNKLLRTP